MCKVSIFSPVSLSSACESKYKHLNGKGKVNKEKSKQKEKTRKNYYKIQMYKQTDSISVLFFCGQIGKKNQTFGDTLLKV